MSSVFPQLLGRLTLVDLLLLLAVVVIVPLGLRLLPFAGQRSRQLLRLATAVQPLGAAAAVVSFLLPTGWTAGAIALLWLLTCAIASLAGLVDLIERRSIRPAALVPAAAAGFLSVGAGWLVISRAGLQPQGFSHEIVELTAVHFHYAGFAATLMAGLLMVALRDRGWLAGYAAGAGMLIVLGVPTTAAGIVTGSGALTVAGPVLLGLGVLSNAGLTAFAIAPRLRPTMGRWLLWISAAGVLVPMLLGVDYALSRVMPIPALDLRAMALIHGDLNALVFSLCGLLGWTLARRPETVDISRPAAATTRKLVWSALFLAVGGPCAFLALEGAGIPYVLLVLAGLIWLGRRHGWLPELLTAFGLSYFTGIAWWAVPAVSSSLIEQQPLGAAYFAAHLAVASTILLSGVLLLGRRRSVALG